jgi:hypothetical protein
VVIHDTTGMGYANTDRNIAKFYTQFTNVLQDYYCERLHKAYLVGMNWQFKLLIRAVHNLLSEKTRAKFVVVGDDQAEMRPNFEPD